MIRAGPDDIIDGNDSMFFNNPSARAATDNLVPVKGIYADHLGIIHLVAVTDLEADFCVSEKGRFPQTNQHCARQRS